MHAKNPNANRLSLDRCQDSFISSMAMTLQLLRSAYRFMIRMLLFGCLPEK